MLQFSIYMQKSCLYKFSENLCIARIVANNRSSGRLAIAVSVLFKNSELVQQLDGEYFNMWRQV